MHRAIAVRYTAGPQAALAELDTLAGELDLYHLYHATRAELLRALDHPYQARTADQRALELTSNPAESPAAAAHQLGLAKSPHPASLAGERITRACS